MRFKVFMSKIFRSRNVDRMWRRLWFMAWCLRGAGRGGARTSRVWQACKPMQRLETAAQAVGLSLDRHALGNCRRRQAMQCWQQAGHRQTVNAPLNQSDRLLGDEMRLGGVACVDEMTGCGLQSPAERNTPSLNRRRASLGKKPPTAFNHELEVGVKRKTQRGCLASQARTASCFWGLAAQDGMDRGTVQNAAGHTAPLQGQPELGAVKRLNLRLLIV